MEDPLYQLAPDGTCLIETLSYRQAEGCRYLDLHLSRPHHSALALGFAIQMNAIRDQLMAVRSDTPLRCCLTLSQAGQVALKITPFAPGTRSWLVAIAPMRLASDDPWLRHKTTQRRLYDTMRATLPKGLDEWLFCNERDEICEGTITNLFVTGSDGKPVTPSVRSGVIPGIFRQHQLSTGQCTDRVVMRDEIVNCPAIMLGNALRGAVPAVLIDVNA